MIEVKRRLLTMIKVIVDVLAFRIDEMVSSKQ